MGAAAEKILAGQTLAERWQTIERIGQGAMGEVWRGRHTLLGHEVAIKFMTAEGARDRGLVARFKREARIAAQLRHRNLVRVDDFGVTDDGRPYLVMEFLRGRTLGALLEATPRPAPALVLHVVQQIGAALDAAHGAGIVHRDLKPENCFLEPDEEGTLVVKVLDFGVAKVSDGSFATANGVVTASQAVLGTPMYMAPEQARGDADVDPRSDRWSLAVIVYEMLTGQMPFEGATVAQLLLQVLRAEFPPASQVAPNLPPAIDRWFARGLAADRAQRFASGRDPAAALAAVFQLAPPATPSHAPPARAFDEYGPTAALDTSSQLVPRTRPASDPAFAAAVRAAQHAHSVPSVVPAAASHGAYRSALAPALPAPARTSSAAVLAALGAAGLVCAATAGLLVGKLRREPTAPVVIVHGNVPNPAALVTPTSAPSVAHKPPGAAVHFAVPTLPSAAPTSAPSAQAAVRAPAVQPEAPRPSPRRGSNPPRAVPASNNTARATPEHGGLGHVGFSPANTTPAAYNPDLP